MLWGEEQMIGRRKSLLKKERPATPIIRVHADALNPLAADRDHGPIRARQPQTAFSASLNKTVVQVQRDGQLASLFPFVFLWRVAPRC